LRGRDIKRYGYNFADLWLITVHNGIQEKNIDRISVDNYPAIKEHLNKYYDKLVTRTDKGDTPYNLRNCAYMDDFSKPKIIYPETTQGAYFALDTNAFVLDKTCFFLTSDYPEYLLATLSSTLFEFAYKHIFSSIELGENGYQYNKHALVLLPIIPINNINNNIYSQIRNNVLKIINTDNQENRLIYINKIDSLIFELYNISTEEINYINKFTGH
jgi:site-specific DNA-methyltransferase (adenine-specific)